MVENIENYLYNIDLEKMLILNGIRLNLMNTTEFKLKDFIQTNLRHKRRFYFESFPFFDNNFSLLLISILSGGFVGILIIACISVKHEDCLFPSIYRKK